MGGGDILVDEPGADPEYFKRQGGWNGEVTLRLPRLNINVWCFCDKGGAGRDVAKRGGYI